MLTQVCVICIISQIFTFISECVAVLSLSSQFIMLCVKLNLSCQMLNNFDCREVTSKHLKLLAEVHLERSATKPFYVLLYLKFLMIKFLKIINGHL